jgi:hypothetical protein
VLKELCVPSFKVFSNLMKGYDTMESSNKLSFLEAAKPFNDDANVFTLVARLIGNLFLRLEAALT